MADYTISFDDLEQLNADNVVEIPLFVNEEEDNPMIEIHNMISLTDMWKATHEIVALCCPIVNFGTDEEPDYQELYQPENIDYAKRKVLVSYYTNIELPDEIEEQYKVLTCTNIVPRVFEHIDQTQYNSIIDGAIKQIEFKKNDALSVAKDIRSILNQILSMIEKLEDIDPKEVQQAIKSFGNLENEGYGAILSSLGVSDELKQTLIDSDDVTYLPSNHK